MGLTDNLVDEAQLDAKQPDIPEDGIPSGPILALDIGAVYTRAILLNVAHGQYRLIARGEAPSTSGAPWNNIIEGVRVALDAITRSTGRYLLDENYNLIMPASGNAGVNMVVGTASAGKPIRAVLVGLMPDISVASGRQAAESIYLQLVETVHLTDRRTSEEQLKDILNARPDVILIAGGTDGGAKDALRDQIHKVALAMSIMEHMARPVVIYMGNRELQGEVISLFEDELEVPIVAANNVRPALDREDLDDAKVQLASMYNIIKSRNTGGFEEYLEWTRERVFPNAIAFSEMIRALSGLESESVLGIDMGSSSTAVVAAMKQGSFESVSGSLGIGHALGETLEKVKIEHIRRWLAMQQDPDDILDFLWNRRLNPSTVPGTPEDLDIFYALTREIVRLATLDARRSWVGVPRRGFLPPFDRLILSGATLSRPAHYGWSVLIALDALLMVGITRVQIDPHSLAPALGALSTAHPHAVIQVLDTGAFIDLGSVVSVSGKVKPGDIAIRGLLTPEGSAEGTPFEVEGNTLKVLPLPPGSRAKLTIDSGNVVRKNSGNRPAIVYGGELGVVIDARGRPWRLPSKAVERTEQFRKWRDALTGVNSE